MNAIDELIGLCWNRTTKNGSEYIYVTQILTFIRELELVLAILSMLQDHELQILKLMMGKSPLMKLHKREVKEFILRLVQQKDFLAFLEKLGVTMLDLTRALNRRPYSNEIKTEVKREYGESSYNKVLNDDYRPSIPKTSTYITPRKPNIQSKYSAIPTKNEPIHTNQSVSDRELLSSQKRTIISLENKIANLDSYVNNLKEQLAHRSGGNVQQLLEKLYERDSTIKSLQQVCSEYQTELEKYQKIDQTNEPILNELIESITKQDVLIDSLKKKLALQEGSKGVKEFMLNLPFLKQYYMFYKYKQENASWGTVVINMLTLIFSSYMMVNFFRLLLYVGTWMVTYHKADIYTYDDYGTRWYSTQSTFVWWKEIEWIERMVYAIGEMTSG